VGEEIDPMPRHVNPTQPARTATAPYNFIPLPEAVLTASDAAPTVNGQLLRPWECHDQFIPGTSSGWIDLEITTLTPLYIRGPILQRQQGWDQRDTRVMPEPYSSSDGRPAIPGSTLRGVIRTLVEILSFSKIGPVTASRPFFRDISPSRISDEYRKHFIDDLGQLTRGNDIQTDQQVNVKAPGYRARVRAGYIDARSRTIRECEFARVEREVIKTAFSQQQFQNGSGPMATPGWGVQHQSCFVAVDSEPQDYFFRRQFHNGKQRHPELYLRFRKVRELSRSQSTNLVPATLVLTGNIPNKHLEFVFLSASSSQDIQVPESTWQRFHDDDQISQWQEKAFPRNQPPNGNRRNSGALRDGEPVFFLTDDAEESESNPDGLVFLGRAQLFRFPYDLSPNDLVPATIREAPLDLTDAIFGCVRPGKASSGTTLKGRVFFEDAVAVGGGPSWTEELLVPRILSAPKPTSFQHYLTQDGTRDARQLTTYLAGDTTAIRGHKLYWHRWDDSRGLNEVRVPENQTQRLADLTQGREDRHSQYTVIQPVKIGVQFNSRIRFENLTDIELGALLAAVDLPGQCAHKVGMGKPLGLGSIRVRATLHVIDRDVRCRSWEVDGTRGDDGSRFRGAFEATMLKHAQASGESLIPSNHGLRRIARLDALFLMLTWRERPGLQSTRQISDLSEFRKRPVLPSPHKVAGKPEPSWPSDPPCPAAPSQAVSGGPTSVVTQSVNVPVRKQDKPKPVQKGQTRSGRLQRAQDKWIARFEGEERSAEIINPGKIPTNVANGQLAEFYVVGQSKQTGIQVRCERTLS